MLAVILAGMLIGCAGEQKETAEMQKSALESIHRVQDGLLMNLSGDFVSQDLRECLSHLAEIVGGAFDVEDVLGNIFKHFCIGK